MVMKDSLFSNSLNVHFLLIRVHSPGSKSLKILAVYLSETFYSKININILRGSDGPNNVSVSGTGQYGSDIRNQMKLKATGAAVKQ